MCVRFLGITDSMILQSNVARFLASPLNSRGESAFEKLRPEVTAKMKNARSNLTRQAPLKRDPSRHTDARLMPGASTVASTFFTMQNVEAPDPRLRLRYGQPSLWATLSLLLWRSGLRKPGNAGTTRFTTHSSSNCPRISWRKAG